MMVFGHVATASIAARWADPKAHLGWVAFFALLADLVDKPLGLVVLSGTLNQGRVYFHSLAVNLALTLLLALLRKPLVYSLALWLHLVCDRMWEYPSVALWPLTGAIGYRELPLAQWMTHALSAYNLVTEALGLVWLTLFITRRMERRKHHEDVGARGTA